MALYAFCKRFWSTVEAVKSPLQKIGRNCLAGVFKAQQKFASLPFECDPKPTLFDVVVDRVRIQVLHQLKQKLAITLAIKTRFDTVFDLGSFVKRACVLNPIPDQLAEVHAFELDLDAIGIGL